MTELDYYHIAGTASSLIGNHSGLKKLADICKNQNRVLDIGCGEGTRLNTLLLPKQRGWGIDLSLKAIQLARHQFPRHHFLIGDAAKLPYDDNYFDLVYSAFSLEHTLDPKAVISEMIRVTKPNGEIVIICPNFGAPNRRSPVSVQNPWLKLLIGFFGDFLPNRSLNWQSVVPKTSYENIDDDTTVEPYLHSLVFYLQSQPVRIITASSLWDQEEKSNNIRKFIISVAGRLHLFPFKYWGPQIFVEFQKKS